MNINAEGKKQKKVNDEMCVLSLKDVGIQNSKRPEKAAGS